MTLQPSQHWRGLVSSHHPLSSPVDTVLLEWRTGGDKSLGLWLRPWSHGWGQAAPTSQPVGMVNSTKIPPRRELMALAGRSLCCPSAPLHADLQLSGWANRESGSSCGSAAICSLPATSRFSRGPDMRRLPFSASTCTLWGGGGRLGTMDRLLPYLLLARGLISAIADTIIWRFFVLICIRWVFWLAWEVTNPTWLKLMRKRCIS